MSRKETVEKPKIELLQQPELYTLDLCGPVKEQLDKIKICGPNITTKPCSPIDTIKCIPNVLCAPIVGPCLPIGPCLPQQCLPVIGPCLPIIGCYPSRWCNPIIGPCIPIIGPCYPVQCLPREPCFPVYGGCLPQIQTTCGPMVTVPGPDLTEIISKVDALAAEIQELKRRIK